jgi:hypothetical protein
MKRLRSIIDRLAAVDDVAVDLAMAAALPSADAASAGRLVRALLARRRPEAKVCLIDHFDVLPKAAQDVIVTNVAVLDYALRHAVANDDSKARVNALRIIALRKAYRHAYLVIELLRHPPDELQAQAAKVLLELALALMARQQEDERLDHEFVQDVQQVRDAVEEGVGIYAHHRQRDVLLALATIGRVSTPRALWHLSNPRHPAARAMAQLISEGAQPALREFMPIMLQVPAAGAMVAAAAARLEWQGGLVRLLPSAHLLLGPALAEPLKNIDAPPALAILPSQQDELAAVPPDPARGLLHWIDALPLSVGDRLAHLARLRGATDPMTRLGALRRLMAMGDAGATQAGTESLPAVQGGIDRIAEAIADFCDGSDVQLCRVVIRYLTRRRWEGLPRLLVRLINCDRDEVRALAGEQLGRVGFGRLWEAWPRLKELQRLAAGRALIKIDPLFHQQLAEKLVHADRETRLRALGMIHGLNQGPLFAPAILALARDADERIVASAIRALGSMPSPAAAMVIEQALGHCDSRVRANAVEALVAIGAKEHLPRLWAMARGDDNRPRANAIAALLETNLNDALGMLMAMLGDPRASQRTSALWLVQAAGVLDMARHVAEMSLGDPDHDVRSRARSVIEVLLAMGVPATDAPRAPSPAEREVAHVA